MPSISSSVLLAICFVIFVAVDADQGKCSQTNTPIDMCSMDPEVDKHLASIPAYQTSGEMDMSTDFRPRCDYPCSVTVHACDVPNAPTILDKGIYPNLVVGLYRNCGMECQNPMNVTVIWFCKKLFDTKYQSSERF